MEKEGRKKKKKKKQQPTKIKTIGQKFFKQHNYNYLFQSLYVQDILFQ